MRRNLLLWLVVAAIAFLFPACHNSTGPDDCTKLLVEAYSSIGAGEPSIVVKLMYDDTNEVPGDEEPSEPLRVVMTDLPSGTYYIKVTSVATTDQPYAVRVLYPACSEPSPTVSGVVNSTDFDFEPDEGDINRNTISLGTSNYVDRYWDVAGHLTDDNVDTVDWLKFVLP